MRHGLLYPSNGCSSFSFPYKTENRARNMREKWQKCSFDALKLQKNIKSAKNRPENCMSGLAIHYDKV